MAFIFCQPDIYRNEMYQDKIFMQGVRPIGADNKIFLSEQAPTEYFIIHSCMSHSNSKIVAISTIKHLSRNYASFQQPSVQEWYSLSTSGQTQNIPNGISLTFMEMDTSCRTQASRKAYELLSWCVMLTLNTDVFKLILRILRYFYLTPLLYKSTFFTLLFHTIPTDIVSRHFQNDSFINSYRYHYQLIGL